MRMWQALARDSVCKCEPKQVGTCKALNNGTLCNCLLTGVACLHESAMLQHRLCLTVFERRAVERAEI